MSEDKGNYLSAGDWVRFQRDNQLVIGEAKYFFVATGGAEYVVTDKGTVAVESVLERRKPND